MTEYKKRQNQNGLNSAYERKGETPYLFDYEAVENGSGRRKCMYAQRT